MGEGKPTEEVLSLQWLADKELRALRRELEIEILNGPKSINANFHNREYLIYKRSVDELRSQLFCLEMLNVPPRGGEFLRE